MKRIMDFEGKRVLVVGASSGIGRQTAVLLSQLGAELVLIARRKEELINTIRLCEGDKHNYKQFDVTKVNEIESLIKSIVNERGALDGLVYAVGISEEIPVGMLDYDKALKTFNTNYFPFVECVRQVTKRGRYSDGCRIVAVSSVSSILGEKSHCAYAGSKAAMDASVRVMAKELAGKGICINTVAPGMTLTEPMKELIEYMQSNGDSYDRTMQRQYLGIGEPEDVARAICFLLSSEAKMITGISLPVDGGFTSSC